MMRLGSRASSSFLSNKNRNEKGSQTRFEARYWWNHVRGFSLDLFPPKGMAQFPGMSKQFVNHGPSWTSVWNNWLDRKT